MIVIALFALAVLFQGPASKPSKQASSFEPSAKQASAEQGRPDGPATPPQNLENPAGANATSKQQPTSHPGNSETDTVLMRSSVIQAIAALAVAIFTGFLVYYNSGLLGATKEAAEASTKSAKAAEIALNVSERAYLHTANWTIEDLSLGHRPIVRFVIKNSGRTPATLLRTGFAHRYSQNLPEAPPELEITDEGRAFIGANGGTFGKHFGVNPSLNAPALLSIEEGTNILWLYVELTYLDRFSQDPHIHRTCMRYSSQQQALVLATEAGYDYSN